MTIVRLYQSDRISGRVDEDCYACGRMELASRESISNRQLSSSRRSNIEGDIRSAALPGGSLVRALLDRRLMGLADMGGASGLIGARWSDVVAAHMDSLTGSEVGIPGGATHVIERVIRLDALPHVASAASKRSLQNPDFVLLGRANGRLIMQAADAKFSIETARSKQVSVAMLLALAEVGPSYTDLLGPWQDDAEIVPGLFFSPRSALSAYVLNGGRGIVRSTVKSDEIVLLEASGTELTGSIPGFEARKRFARMDGLASRLDTDLLVGLYYTRLSSAAGASWFDMNRPLLGPPADSGTDFEAVDREIVRRMDGYRSGYELICDWAEDAAIVRADRNAIEQAASLPLPNRELREWVQTDAEVAGVEPPSLNRVRRELQRWVHAKVLDQVGIIRPNQGPLEPCLAEIRSQVDNIGRDARIETTRIVLRLAQASKVANDG